MTFVTRKALPRRTFLRGVGTTLALPLLDSMIPALRAKSPKPPPRLGFVYVSNGVIQNQWNPAIDGPGYELPPILKPLATVLEHVNVVSGLSHLQADTFGDGTGDHPRASAAWLTGVHAYDRTQPGIEVRLATSADQLAARAIGQGTRIASLELNLDSPTQGACDSGDCFYVNTVSWRNETTPNPAESNPRIVFQRLFGDGGGRRTKIGRSRGQGQRPRFGDKEANRLAGTLGAGDRTKLSEYLDSVRDIEQRIKNVEAQGAQSIDLPERPFGVPDTFDEHAKMMFDLLLVAYRADATRIFSMVMARELSTRTYANIGVPEQHHPTSHHRNDPEQIAKKAKDRYVPCAVADLLPGEIAGHAGWRRIAAGSQPDSVRRRHGRRQSAPSHGSALSSRRKPGRPVQDRPPFDLPA